MMVIVETEKIQTQELSFLILQSSRRFAPHLFHPTDYSFFDL